MAIITLFEKGTSFVTAQVKRQIQIKATGQATIVRLFHYINLSLVSVMASNSHQ